MRIMHRTGLVAAVFALGACLFASEPVRVPDQGAAAKGKVIYQRYCASCHGAEARGNGVIAGELRLPPADLTRLAKRNGGRFPFDRVARAIDGRQKTGAHGAPDMPLWGEVFPKTEGTEAPSVQSAIGRITHYLWSVQVAKP